MTLPITPDQAETNRRTEIPDEVIEIFNNLIVKNLSANGESHFKQKEAIGLIASKLNIQRQIVFDNNWMDVEPSYRAAGWSVKYDSPSIGDDFDAYFVFKKKRKR